MNLDKCTCCGRPRIICKLTLVIARWRNKLLNERRTSNDWQRLANQFQRERNDLEAQLHRIVKARVDESHTEPDVVAITVKVDRRYASQYPAMWESAIEQIRVGLLRSMR